MKDKDKLQVVYYVNVKNIDGKDVPSYIDGIRECLKCDDSVCQYFIPVMDERFPPIEFYWPHYEK